MIVTQDFFGCDSLTVARELIGCTVISRVGGLETRGRIVETEAYLGRIDPAAHSYRGPTERVRALYEGKGLAYIYLIYGMHWCLNFSSGRENEPECVLIRALEPLDGIDTMMTRRRTDKPQNLCSGPGKLCAALGITREQYGCKLFEEGSALTVEYGLASGEIRSSPRIGIDYAGEARDFPWRFTLTGSPWLSRP